MQHSEWRVILVTLISLTACDGVEPGNASAETVVGALRIGSVLGEESDPGFAEAVRPATLEFPRDHGAHPLFRSEWWYFTAVLDDSAGHRYGTQFTLFRQALSATASSASPWQNGQIYLGHLAVTDVRAGRHIEAERMARGHPGMAGTHTVPFEIWLDGWRWSSVNSDLLPMRMLARDARIGLDLTLAAEGSKPIVLHGDSGFSAKGPGSASYYYSIPRIPIVGQLSIDGRDVAVTGSGWLDREWSTGVLPADVVGWAWFGLHLDDGSDLMVFRLRRSDGSRHAFDAGTWIDPLGQVIPLARDAFDLQPTGYWGEGSNRWPVKWTISCALCGGRLMVQAEVNDQRMDTSIEYWEGLVAVKDERGARIGSGYLELTGY